ncbi:hypothetical protein RRG08_057528, partial [Elysia crispata]
MCCCLPDSDDVHFGICNLAPYAEDFVKIQTLRLEGPHVPC